MEKTSIKIADSVELAHLMSFDLTITIVYRIITQLFYPIGI